MKVLVVGPSTGSLPPGTWVNRFRKPTHKRFRSTWTGRFPIRKVTPDNRDGKRVGWRIFPDVRVHRLWAGALILPDGSEIEVEMDNPLDHPDYERANSQIRRQASDSEVQEFLDSQKTDEQAGLRAALERIVKFGPGGHQFKPWRNDYPGFDQRWFDESVRRGELHPSCSDCSASNNTLTTERVHASWEAHEAARAALAVAQVPAQEWTCDWKPDDLNPGPECPYCAGQMCARFDGLGCTHNRQERHGYAQIPAQEERLRTLSDAATPGRWYVDGPEFGGVWVVTGGEIPKDSFAVHPSADGQPYAVLAGMGMEDAEFIAAAVNYVRRALGVESKEEGA